MSPESAHRNVFLFIVSSALVILLLYFTIGLLADLLVIKMPESMERKLGKIFVSKYERAAEESRIIDIYKKIKHSNAALGDYSIYIKHSDTVNAMALPGNNIVFFSEIFDVAESDEELAFVLGHEIGHFKNKDHLKGFGRALVLMATSLILFGQENSITELLITMQTNISMKFSQVQEVAADKFGVMVIQNAYGNAQGAITFMKRINELKRSPKFAYFFASHPHPLTRLEIMQEQVGDVR